eukprot:Nk52_evm1s1773 gene=Nk52_evmTU1s1773
MVLERERWLYPTMKRKIRLYDFEWTGIPGLDPDFNTKTKKGDSNKPTTTHEKGDRSNKNKELKNEKPVGNGQSGSKTNFPYNCSYCSKPGHKAKE